MRFLIIITTIITQLITITNCAAKPFWVTVELDEIKWQEKCLTTSLCAHPRFQIQKDLITISERSTISWPIIDNFHTTLDPFTTFWPSGRIEDITISSQVIGIDTAYQFPRVCDQTPAVRIFDDTVSTDNKTVHLIGRCFHVTLGVTKHPHQCPWCPTPQQLAIHTEVEMAPMFFGSTDTLQWTIVGIACFAVLASTAFAILLVVYVRSKRIPRRQNLDINVQPRLIPYTMKRPSPTKNDYDSRYETPWDQQNRPLTYWMSRSTVTSPESLQSDNYRIPAYAPPLYPPPPH